MDLKIRVLAIAIGLGCFAATASAVTTTDATFNSVSPGATFNYNLNGSGGSTTAGTFNWTGTSGGSINLGNFTAFCIELTQTISTGSNYAYNVDPLQNGPNPNPMGSTKATEIEELWAKYFSSIFIGTPAQQQQNAAAFQICVWDLEYGSVLSTTSSLDLASGTFYATNLSDPDVVQAQTQLAYIASLGGTGAVANLVALDNPSNQDMVTASPAVPEPVTASLSTLGLGGLILLALRRRRHA
jgi:hypothetical protein